jgi:hypothetical protein
MDVSCRQEQNSPHRLGHALDGRGSVVPGGRDEPTNPAEFVGQEDPTPKSNMHIW